MGEFNKSLVWRNGMEIINELDNVLNGLTEEERNGFWFQATRCAASIISNIAEGSFRSTVQEQEYHLQLALNAAFELETHILNGQCNCLDEAIIKELLQLIVEEQMMLFSFIDKLRT